ncbi:MAG: ABC transporter substrate-binding protein [Solirubrobacteraceae bacterium]|jgi:NitT/TauT family transport system substrate-binding protein
MDLLRISATSHGINYLPEYYATATGAFARRGLEVQAWARDPWTQTLEDLATGGADLVLGGVWVPAMYAGAGRELVAVGQLNARFPMAIVTREPISDFSWSWLSGKTVLAPGAGGTAPYEFTAGVMREHGFDPASVKFVRDLSTAMLVELFEHGLGDALIADPLTTKSLELTKTGHAACWLAAVGGPMPNSVYYTERARLDELQPRLVALMGGISEAMAALSAGADPSTVINAQWPDGPRAALLGAAETMAANGTWSGVRIEPAALDRWVGILSGRGLTVSEAGYPQLVDPRVVDAVERTAAGPVVVGEPAQ